MFESRRGGRIALVSSHDQTQRLELRLVLDRGVDPIRGRISMEDGATVEFAGWLALAGALQRLSSPEETAQVAEAPRAG